MTADHPRLTEPGSGRTLANFPHGHAYLRECWALRSNLRQSATVPTWTTEPTIHCVVIESVTVEEGHRRQGNFKRFLNELCSDRRFELVIVEGVQNPILAEVLMRWGWYFDPVVMDFYFRQEDRPSA